MFSGCLAATPLYTSYFANYLQDHENVFVLIAIIYYIIIICTCTRVYTRSRLFFSMRSTNTARVNDAVYNVYIYFFFSSNIYFKNNVYIYIPIYRYPLRPSLVMCVYYIVNHLYNILVAKYYCGRYFYIIICSYHNWHQIIMLYIIVKWQ